MKKALYKNIGDKIDGNDTVSVWKGTDYMISGKHGWIYPAGKSGRMAVVVCHTPECEHKLYCDIKELDFYQQLIKVPVRAGDALFYANNPNSRKPLANPSWGKIKHLFPESKCSKGCK